MEGNNNYVKNKSCIPDEQLELLTKSFMQSIIDYWESEEGQNAFNDYLESKEITQIENQSPANQEAVSA